MIAKIECKGPGWAGSWELIHEGQVVAQGESRDVWVSAKRAAELRGFEVCGASGDVIYMRES